MFTNAFLKGETWGFPARAVEHVETHAAHVFLVGDRAFKIKIGRGAKWMPRADGDDRDVEVVKLIRQHAGDDTILGVDANNGYDLVGTMRFLDRVADVGEGEVAQVQPLMTADARVGRHRFGQGGRGRFVLPEKRRQAGVVRRV